MEMRRISALAHSYFSLTPFSQDVMNKKISMIKEHINLFSDDSEKLIINCVSYLERNLPSKIALEVIPSLKSCLDDRKYIIETVDSYGKVDIEMKKIYYKIEQVQERLKLFSEIMKK